MLTGVLISIFARKADPQVGHGSPRAFRAIGRICCTREQSSRVGIDNLIFLFNTDGEVFSSGVIMQDVSPQGKCEYWCGMSGFDIVVAIALECSEAQLPLGRKVAVSRKREKTGCWFIIADGFMISPLLEK